VGREAMGAGSPNWTYTGAPTYVDGSLDALVSRGAFHALPRRSRAGSYLVSSTACRRFVFNIFINSVELLNHTFIDSV
jgi:hypothetical protein